ncbi:hypothetical protein OROMI_007830 [Orobanche minor]
MGRKFDKFYRIAKMPKNPTDIPDFPTDDNSKYKEDFKNPPKQISHYNDGQKKKKISHIDHHQHHLHHRNVHFHAESSEKVQFVKHEKRDIYDNDNTNIDMEAARYIMKKHKDFESL